MNDNHKDTGQDEARQARWTAYALDQLDACERRAVEAEIGASAEAARAVEETHRLARQLREQAAREAAGIGPSAGLRAAVEARLARATAGPEPEPQRRGAMSESNNRSPARRVWIAAAACAALVLVAVPAYFAWVRPGGRELAGKPTQNLAGNVNAKRAEGPGKPSSDGFDTFEVRNRNERRIGESAPSVAVASEARERAARDLAAEHDYRKRFGDRQGHGAGAPEPARGDPRPPSKPAEKPMPRPESKPAAQPMEVDGRVGRTSPRAPRQAQSDLDLLMGRAGGHPGTRPGPSGSGYDMAVPAFSGPPAGQMEVPGLSMPGGPKPQPGDKPMGPGETPPGMCVAPGAEQYDPIIENPFLPVAEQPKSTFSIDVDTASYANVRRFLSRGQLPPRDAVRIEEMVNYFRYDYPLPQGDVPFSVNMEVTQCPWQPDHRLLRVGLKGNEVDRREQGMSNLVFLLDVSGSMADQDKLPLVKEAMRMLVGQLDENDRVAIVTYAGNSGLHLESTGGHDRDKIIAAIDRLQAGGSTHGSAGIQLAYEQATRYFVKGGVNRVIWCTDGDLNVGITRDEDLVKLIEEKRASGVFLTVLGFGAGNLKDSKLEKLADHGNGIYAYIDGVREARKVLVEQLTGSLVTIAKDVKLQIEFNPAQVAEYRLIGYENRVLAARDFDDDAKDAGEIGAGHTVTALYELVPAAGAQGREPGQADAEAELKYQKGPEPQLTAAAQSGELLTLSLRYKAPDADQSRKIEFPLKDEGKRFGEASKDFQFAAAVAQFGMILRGSRHAGQATLSAVEEIAASAVGEDPGAYRAEFVDLVRKARRLRGPSR